MIYCEDCSSYECGCPERKEIESLRQQLASRDAEVAELVAALEYYAKEDERNANHYPPEIAKSVLAKVRKSHEQRID